MTTAIDLVADIGEGFGSYSIANDDGLLEILSSANVACGFHAGDPRTMDTAVKLCVERGVSIGAHPGFPDRVGFGRRSMELSYDELRTDMLYQIGALDAFVRSHGGSLGHVAPHGRLGNMLWTRTDYAIAVADAVASYDPSLIVLTQEGELAKEARKRGLPVGLMGAADRAYENDGTLVKRSEPGAVLHDDDEIIARTVRMVTEGLVTSVHGVDIEVDIDTILLHGDNAGSLERATRLRQALENADVTITPLPQILAKRTEVLA
ncbi:LamB/YcsF family protein [Paenarthrobacter sp. NPDC091711]|uniref:LamB/YcsF family protein n=1 Tax=Paenarthrobacter sp. NPDC091711 TaxID=3364385 RepID=UPI0037F5500A